MFAPLKSFLGKSLVVACNCHLVFLFHFLTIFCAAFEPLGARDLKFSEMIDPNVNLCLTTFEGWRSASQKSKVKNQNLSKPKNF